MQMAKSGKCDDAHGALGHAREKELAQFQEGAVGHPRQAIEQQDRDQRRQHRVDIVGQHVDRLFVEVGHRHRRRLGDGKASDGGDHP